MPGYNPGIRSLNASEKQLFGVGPQDTIQESGHKIDRKSWIAIGLIGPKGPHGPIGQHGPYGASKERMGWIRGGGE